MAQSILRFAHAGELRLNEPLRGVGRLSASDRRIAEDAPFAAWERVVEACVDRDVAFLLLTPRTTVGPWSVLDRQRLLDGFRQLEEFGIGVYWALSADESSFGDDDVSWPDNVVRLSGPADTATVVREGRTVATICFGAEDDIEPPIDDGIDAPPETLRPLRIEIAAEPSVVDDREDGCEWLPSHRECDYLAGWGAPAARTRKLSSAICSDAGSPLWRSAREANSGGVNVVEWDGERVSDVQSMPTSPIRRIQCLLGLTPESTREEVAGQIQQTLAQIEPSAPERLWIVEWQVSGTGSLFESLRSDSTQREVERLAAAAGDGDGGIDLVHRWVFRAADAGSSALAARLRERLSELTDSDWAGIRRELESDWAGRGFAAAAECLAPLKAEDVREAAEERVETWLAGAAGDAA